MRGRSHLPSGLIASVLAAALCAGAASARADPLPSGPPPVASEAPAGDPEKRRDPAEYRGRTRYATAAEALAWIPRILFLPAFAATEFGLRRPAYVVTEAIDRHHVVPIVDHWLNPTPDISWSPTLSFDLSGTAVHAPGAVPGEPDGEGGAARSESWQIVPFIGLQGKFRNLLVPGHDLALWSEFGGRERMRVTARDQWQLGRSLYAGVRGEYLARSDRAFFGLGSRSEIQTRFSETRSEGFAFAGFAPNDHLRVELTQGFRDDLTGPGDAPSIESHFDTRKIPGFGHVRLAMAMLDLTLDSRPFPEENTGVRLVADATYGRDVEVATRSFLSGELDLEGAVEVSCPDRVLAARVYAMDTQPLGREGVPFAQLATLGWDKHYGFVLGRFRGESALLGQLQYRYPVNYFVDAQWTVSVGNAFSAHFGDLQPSALTGSFGVGVRTRRTGSLPMQLTFAMGTTRFDEPLGFGSLRVYFGTAMGL